MGPQSTESYLELVRNKQAELEGFTSQLLTLQSTLKDELTALNQIEGVKSTYWENLLPQELPGLPGYEEQLSGITKHVSYQQKQVCPQQCTEVDELPVAVLSGSNESEKSTIAKFVAQQGTTTWELRNACTLCKLYEDLKDLCAKCDWAETKTKLESQHSPNWYVLQNIYLDWKDS